MFTVRPIERKVSGGGNERLRQNLFQATQGQIRRTTTTAAATTQQPHKNNRFGRRETYLGHRKRREIRIEKPGLLNRNGTLVC